jgi:hypothetical protein
MWYAGLKIWSVQQGFHNRRRLCLFWLGMPLHGTVARPEIQKTASRMQTAHKKTGCRKSTQNARAHCYCFEMPSLHRPLPVPRVKDLAELAIY